MESKYSKTLDEILEDVAFEAINSRDDIDSWHKAKAEAKAKLNDLLRRVEVAAEERMGDAVIARMRQSNYQWEKAESFIQSYQLQKTDDVHGIFKKLEAEL